MFCFKQYLPIGQHIWFKSTLHLESWEFNSFAWNEPWKVFHVFCLSGKMPGRGPGFQAWNRSQCFCLEKAWRSCLEKNPARVPGRTQVWIPGFKGSQCFCLEEGLEISPGWLVRWRAVPSSASSSPSTSPDAWTPKVPPQSCTQPSCASSFLLLCDSFPYGATSLFRLGEPPSHVSLSQEDGRDGVWVAGGLLLVPAHLAGGEEGEQGPHHHQQ